MKILSLKYIVVISLIILLSILYLTYTHTKTKEEKPERAVLVLDNTGGWIDVYG